jgi:hypothetical protein
MLTDHEVSSGVTGGSGRALSVREEQRAFRYGAATLTGHAPIRSWPGKPVDAALVEHSQAAVDRLTLLVADAVRGADDDVVASLDKTLQVAERLLALARGERLP